jgi:hypothetical protein
LEFEVAATEANGTSAEVNSDDERSSSSSSDKETKNLYELLDSTASGIAEWILPLMLAANLTDVHWIRPAEAFTEGEIMSNVCCKTTTATIRQIPTDTNSYRVGA